VAHAVAADVEQDPVEPGIEPARVAERSPAGPGPGYGFLSCVFGLVAVAEDESGEPIALEQPSVVEGREGFDSMRVGPIRRRAREAGTTYRRAS
jgi:hypothetical protein